MYIINIKHNLIYPSLIQKACVREKFCADRPIPLHVLTNKHLLSVDLVNYVLW